MAIRTVFFGTPNFAVPILQSLLKIPEVHISLVVTQPDKPVGRKQILTPSPVKQIALQQDIATFEPTTLKTPEAFERIVQEKAELIVLAAYGKIIPKAILDLPRFQCLNVHPSLLPKYRGATPMQTALLHGDKETGVTIMIMEPSLDTGPIVAQERVAILPGETYLQLDQRLAQKAASMLQIVVPQWLAGKITAQAQQHDLATHTKVLSKEDGQIDWLKSAQEIERQIRAYKPWPGSYTSYQGKRIKILAGKTITKESAQPGKIYFSEKTIVIGCGKNSGLVIEQIQEEGKKPMSGSEFIVGHPQLEDQALA
ncbi:MAG: methionyl-tRNA formyltransferase [Candidatus Abawacabacteria bacterium]|nr:methionyl-tRNA formyltransferase [Candidatus Abawacabacteria bacterium]